MIIQISDSDHFIIKCHTFKNMPKMHSFYISIHGDHLYISRNGTEEMKVHLGESGKSHLPVNAIGKKNFSKLIKSKPLKQGVVLIKLEKEGG